MDVSEAQRLRSLEDENSRLIRLVADLGLDKGDAEGGDRKKSMPPLDCKRERRSWNESA